ncbi:hypothetical protein NEUTE2DRAFT_125046 [Neurospora tetrasperma FGSC 2509]|nr:hypothetical protein NEUTE2DRAFT_125046 [Neurospora tetrasperma FGSC 2509]
MNDDGKIQRLKPFSTFAHQGFFPEENSKDLEWPSCVVVKMLLSSKWVHQRLSVPVREDQENKDIDFPPVTILKTFGRTSIIGRHHFIDEHQQFPYSGEDECVDGQQNRRVYRD